jgi:hypothetical protein
MYRGAWWTPVMTNGSGYAITPAVKPLVYYKTLPKSVAACNATSITTDANGKHTWNPNADLTHVGKCVPLPNGMRYLRGFNMAEMSGGPADDGGFRYFCEVNFGESAPGFAAQGYDSIKKVQQAGCGLNHYLRVAVTGPGCWDGRYLDTPNHHDHVDYARGNDIVIPDSQSGPNTIWRQCGPNHPYPISVFSAQFAYKIDKDFVAGRWRLSSDDQMPMEHEAGSTLHVDYWEAWSPPAKDAWESNCIDGHNSSNNGELCDNTQIIGMDGGAYANNRYIPLNRKGRSRYIKGNGTFTGEFTAVADGELGIYGIGGLTVNVDEFSVVDVTDAGPRNSVATVIPAI